MITLAGAQEKQQSAPRRVVEDGILIEGVTLISPERAKALPLADVVIRDGRIAEIGTNLVAGPGSRRIDGHGRYLIPGLIDSHVHVGHSVGLDDDALDARPELLAAYNAQVPRAYLAFGYTTLVDVDLKPQDRAWFEGSPVHPNLLHCGRGVRTAGGYGVQQVSAESVAKRQINLVYEPEQASNWPTTLDSSEYTPARAVERVVEVGGSCVKIFVEPGFGGMFHWPVPSAKTLDAVHAAAAAHHLPMLVHATAVDAWRAAIGAHAEVIAHGLWHWPGDQTNPVPTAEARAVIEAAAQTEVRVQPTLQVLYGEQAIFDQSIMDDPRFARAMPRSIVAYLHTKEAQAAQRAVADSYVKMMPNAAALIGKFGERATATLRLMDAAGTRLLFGSDTPAGGGIEGIGNPPGLNGRLEMQRWAEAGVPLTRILRAATLDNATMFGMAKERGTIEVGKRADLVLLSADPLSNVKAYDAIEMIFLNGRPLVRDELLPAN
jgi:imidazolonepropionase-like amidohydrolase